MRIFFVSRYEPEVPRDLPPLDGYTCTLTFQECNARGIATLPQKGSVKRKKKSRKQQPRVYGFFSVLSVWFLSKLASYIY